MVEAIIMEDAQLSVPLLGMSFLKRTNMKNEGDRLTLIQRYSGADVGFLVALDQGVSAVVMDGLEVNRRRAEQGPREAGRRPRRREQNFEVQALTLAFLSRSIRA